MNHMKIFSTLALAAASSAAFAQTPAINPMPDGSHDMYVGLGVMSSPRYEGGRERRVRAVPVIQVEWSNGVFISGTSAGMHLSSNPAVEYGPLLSFKPRRSASGDGLGAIGPTNSTSNADVMQPPTISNGFPVFINKVNPLAGVEPVPSRLQAGGFLNYYITPTLRLANSVLAGSGRDRNGVLWNVDLQTMARPVSARHAVSLSAGLTFANRNYNDSYFGVTLQEAYRSRIDTSAPGGGLNDVHASVRWNWSLSPSWMVTSGVRAWRLQGDAKNSSLAQRPTNFTVSTGLAYRF
jgi:outer membrane protein